MPEVALSGRQRHKQRRQSNSRLVIQDCHAMFDTKPIRYLTASFSSRYTYIFIYLEKIDLNHNVEVMFEPNLDCIELISRAQSH